MKQNVTLSPRDQRTLYKSCKIAMGTIDRIVERQLMDPAVCGAEEAARYARKHKALVAKRDKIVAYLQTYGTPTR